MYALQAFRLYSLNYHLSIVVNATLHLPLVHYSLDNQQPIPE